MVAVSLLPTPLEAGCSSESPLMIFDSLECMLETTTSPLLRHLLGLNLMVFPARENTVNFFAFFVILEGKYLHTMV